MVNLLTHMTQQLVESSLFNHVDTLVSLEKRKSIAVSNPPVGFVVLLSERRLGRPLTNSNISTLQTRMAVLLALSNVDTERQFSSSDKTSVFVTNVRSLLQGNLLAQGNLWFRSGQPLETGDDLIWWLDEYEHIGIYNTEQQI